MRPYLCVGTIVKPQGIKGEVKVAPETDDIARFGRLKRVFLLENGQYTPLKVLSGRTREGFAYLTLEGFADMNAAETLRGKDLYVSREDAVKLPAGRYFIADLIGCRVQDDQGKDLGTLQDVLQAGGNDVYVVKKDGEKDLLFPAIRALLKTVDVESGRIVVDAARLTEVAVYAD